MKKIRVFLVSASILSIIIPLSGCWNYKEVDSLAIVSGVAVDKKDDLYLITTEIIDIQRGREITKGTKIITSEGQTIFDAVRNTIKTVGKRLYWSHAEILIISEEIAEEGIVPIADWVSRDAEPRLTLHFLISREKTAKEILEQAAISGAILSYELDDMLTSQKSLSYAFDAMDYQFMQELAAAGISATLPTIYLKQDDDKHVAEISGTAVFKADRLVGFLDGEETKTMLFIKNKIKGGVLAGTVSADGSNTKISLEILKNKTKIKPHQTDSKITIGIRTKTDVALDEIVGSESFMEAAALAKLKETFEEALEENIRTLVKKTQEEFDSDIFGFGKAVRMNMPDLWKQIDPEWSEIYKTIDVDVQATINIKNSAIMSKPVKVGD
jgi:spore germination protein KC